MRNAPRFKSRGLFFGKLPYNYGNAGVVQWQNGSFPSCIRGFDSLHPLHTPEPAIERLAEAFFVVLQVNQSGLGEVDQAVRFFAQRPAIDARQIVECQR
jgi:hypothetical protein